MKNLTYTFLCLLFSVSVYSQIKILDPQAQWRSKSASIQDVSFTVNPIGTYAEITIKYTTKISEIHQSWNDNQLEFIHNFTLPSDIVFNDSWLWINDYISKGEIYESSEGTAIYEEIVDRQQDPSILTKLSPTNYNFKIYPMFVDSNRTIKLSYLQPFKIVNGIATVDLPVDLLQDSKEIPEDIDLTLISDQDWLASMVDDRWEITEQTVDEKKYKFIGTSIGKPYLTFATTHIDQSYYFDVYEQGNEQYFQLQLDPELNIEGDPINIAILYDQNPNTTYQGESIQTSDFIDLVNSHNKVVLAYHDFVPRITSDSWADADNNHVLDILNEGYQDGGHNTLSSLLPYTLDQLEMMGEDAKLLIFSTSRGFDDIDEYTNFKNSIQQYLDEMSIDLTIDIIDMSTFKEYNGPNDRGLVNLYKNITSQTEGQSFIMSEGSSYTDAIKYMTSVDELWTDVYNIDLKVEEGFVYDVYSDELDNGNISLSSPLSMYGKIVGEGPFSVSINAVYGSDVINKEIALTPNLISPGEYTQSIHAAKYLLLNEDIPARKDEIIKKSIEERLLSSQTIFLCLERDTTSVSGNEEDESTVSTSEKEKLNISVYPNPFSSSVIISLPDGWTNADKYQIHILNSVGELIEDLSNKIVENNITWSPNNIAPGVYYVKFTSEKNSATQRIIYIN